MRFTAAGVSVLRGAAVAGLDVLRHLHGTQPGPGQERRGDDDHADARIEVDVKPVGLLQSLVAGSDEAGDQEHQPVGADQHGDEGSDVEGTGAVRSLRAAGVTAGHGRLPYQNRMLRMMTMTAPTPASLVGCWYHGRRLSPAS